MKDARARDNAILQELVDQDQLDRTPKHWIGHEQEIVKKDLLRRKHLLEMLKQGLIKTGRDYYNAAMLFQHGETIEDIQSAQSLAEKSMKLHEEDAKWLYAAATDRLLLRQGKKQKFGTQFETKIEINPQNNKQKKTIQISPFDKRTSDALRKRFNVPCLIELLKMEEKYTDIYFSKG